MNLSLKGKNAFVGGSSKGIGKAAAQELALLGANVTLVGRHADTLGKALGHLDTSKGQKHQFIVVDFSNTDDVERKANLLASQQDIHILVNNTGGPPAGPITDATPEAFLRAFQEHLICNHLLTGAFLPGMIKSGYGRIINIISTSVKQPLDGLGVSNTVRAAVANWAKTLANEVGPYGITVNNVLPGATMTDRLHEIAKGHAAKAGISAEEVFERWKNNIPVRRIGNPEEVGAAVAFLATPAAAYISGINLPVDGGRTSCL